MEIFCDGGNIQKRFRASSNSKFSLVHVTKDTFLPQDILEAQNFKNFQHTRHTHVSTVHSKIEIHITYNYIHSTIPTVATCRYIAFLFKNVFLISFDFKNVAPRENILETRDASEQPRV